jgi:hypothetical protein
MRDPEVFDLIKNAIMDLQGRLVNICKITEVKNVLNDVVVIVDVKYDKINEFVGV